MEQDHLGCFFTKLFYSGFIYFSKIIKNATKETENQFYPSTLAPIQSEIPNNNFKNQEIIKAITKMKKDAKFFLAKNIFNKDEVNF